ncbi:MAG: DUF1801 domain-containing protein [Chloroflexota bacterium]
MDNNKIQFTTIDEYIATFPEEVQVKLNAIREVIKASAPEAEEKISYQIPTFYQNGNLIHFAAFKNHIGIYPTPNGIEAFSNELSKYDGGKGSKRIPMNAPLPLDLISRIVKFRVADNMKKTKGTR